MNDTLSTGFTFLAQAPTDLPPDSSWLVIGIGLGLLALAIFAIELFIPTAGMLGILCGAVVIASIISFFYHSTSAGVFAIVTYIVASPFILVYGVKLWSGSPIGRRLILGGTETVATRGLDEEEVADELAKHREADREAADALIGMIAVAATPLRPVGVIRLGDRRMDALAESGIIDQDTEVEIVEIIDNQIKVRPQDPTTG